MNDVKADLVFGFACLFTAMFIAILVVLHLLSI